MTDTPTPDAPSGAPRPGSGRPLPRILLVDDEPESTEMLALRLGKRGFSAARAASGEEALEYLAREGADVVVMDVKMPGMGGMRALERIRTGFPGVEVIMLSGHADMEVAVEGMRLGAFGYLMKPTDFDELLFKIEDAYTQCQLDRRAAARNGA
ncbi:response regulator [Nitratidesulfovibrio sp.]|uniref:response regulator n=1 Tax=Nitratidesulfovibrio sp. TaxID=2802297 RepID=UPI0033415BCA